MSEKLKVRNALREAIYKFTPQHQLQNPIMFAVYVASVLTLFLFIYALFSHSQASAGFTLAIALGLWLTLLCANFAEAIAEAPIKNQKTIPLIETIQHRKIPNETSLTIFLITLTIIFLLVCISLLPFSIYSTNATNTGKIVNLVTLIALFVCLIPTTISGLRPTIKIAGAIRMMQQEDQAAAIEQQLTMTCGALTIFNITSCIAKYFAILPAAFSTTYPDLNALNIMHLATPQTAVLSTVIFNALIMIFLMPLALYGVTYRQTAPSILLRNNILFYGLSGLFVPFFGIKFIDTILKGLSLL